MNQELPDVQGGFIKVRDQIVNIFLGHRKGKGIPEKHRFLLY